MTSDSVGRLKVCFVSSYPPSRARLSEFAKALVDHITLGNHSVTFSVLSDTKAADRYRGVEVIPVWDPEKPLTLLRIPGAVLKLKPDLVHFNLHFAVFGRGRLPNMLGFLTVYTTHILSRLIGYKTTVTLHNIPERINLEKVGLHPTLGTRIGLLVAEKLVLSCHEVVVTMRSYVSILGARFRRQVRWVPHGAWNLNCDDAEGGNPSHRDIVLFLGYLGPYKDLKLLRESFDAMGAGRRFRLVVAGSSHPNYPEESERQLAQLRPRPLEVEYVGYVPDENLGRLLQRTRVVVLPYRTATGTSGVLHLVCHAGVPVVATDLPEFRELQEDGASMLLTAQNPKSMAEKIQLLLEDDRLWKQMSQRNIEFSLSRSWDKVACEYVELYKGLMK